MLLVREDTIAMAILMFLERKKLVVEGAGAVPLAALMENKDRFKGKRLALIVSGGNIDFSLIDRIINKGLVSSGRIGIFEVIVKDIPGSLHALTGLISASGGNILNVVHERFSEDLSIGKAKLVFTIETKGRKHLDDLCARLASEGYELRGK